MKRSEKEVNLLTRQLMKESLEQPSPSLNLRIMEMIRQEMEATRICYINKMPSLSSILTGLFIYLVIIAGVVYLFQNDPNSTDLLLANIRSHLPMILTICSGVSFYFLYGELDKWLRRKEEKESI